MNDEIYEHVRVYITPEDRTIIVEDKSEKLPKKVFLEDDWIGEYILHLKGINHSLKQSIEQEMTEGTDEKSLRALMELGLHYQREGLDPSVICEVVKLLPEVHNINLEDYKNE